MEMDAPPVNFILRPHHLNILAMITLLFKQFDRLRFHPAFLIRVHEIILQEISEVHILGSSVSECCFKT